MQYVVSREQMTHLTFFSAVFFSFILSYLCVRLFAALTGGDGKTVCTKKPHYYSFLLSIPLQDIHIHLRSPSECLYVCVCVCVHMCMYMWTR